MMGQFAMLRILGSTPNNKKIVMTAPTLALCQQTYEALQSVFKSVYAPNNPYYQPLNIVIHTGESHASRHKLNYATIIISTPEKFASACRQPTIVSHWTDKVRLVIFDEFHLMGNGQGSSYEELIAYLKNRNVRLIGLSAAIPNWKVITTVFAKKNEVASVACFNEYFRPIKLMRHFVGVSTNVEIDGNRIIKAFMRTTRSIIRKHEKSPTYKENSILCFVQTEKQTEELAKMFLSEHGTGLTLDIPKFTKEENARLSGVQNSIVRNLLLSGIGIHHAGLQENDRTFVEQMYREQRIRLLISTSTLAAGINTPASIVFIVGTAQYDYKENVRINVPISSIHQMMGRAGRVDNDINLWVAHAYVITTKVDAKRICHADVEPVMSQLLKDDNFEETLNAHLAHCHGADNYISIIEW